LYPPNHNEIKLAKRQAEGVGSHNPTGQHCFLFSATYNRPFEMLSTPHRPLKKITRRPLLSVSSSSSSTRTVDPADGASESALSSTVEEVEQVMTSGCELALKRCSQSGKRKLPDVNALLGVSANVSLTSRNEKNDTCEPSLTPTGTPPWETDDCFEDGVNNSFREIPDGKCDSDVNGSDDSDDSYQSYDSNAEDKKIVGDNNYNWKMFLASGDDFTTGCDRVSGGDKDVASHSNENGILHDLLGGYMNSSCSDNDDMDEEDAHDASVTFVAIPPAPAQQQKLLKGRPVRRSKSGKRSISEWAKEEVSKAECGAGIWW